MLLPLFYEGLFLLWHLVTIFSGRDNVAHTFGQHWFAKFAVKDHNHASNHITSTAEHN